MDSPTSSAYSEPRTPTSSATTDFSTPSTPRTQSSTFTYTPDTVNDSDIDVNSPLRRLSFSPIALDLPTPRKKSTPLFLSQQSGAADDVYFNTSISRPEPDRRPSIFPFQPADPFSTLTLESPIAYGQWSKVSKAISRSSSPAIDGDRAKEITKEVFAAKVGSGARSAVDVLRDEARILSRLSQSADYDRYIVGYHGYDLGYKAVILEYLPLNLEDWIQQLECGGNEVARLQRVKDHLLPICSHLIEGLAFMHTHEVIHGDIKPGNILLRMQRQHPSAQHNGTSWDSQIPTLASDNTIATSQIYQPVYCDFTASFKVGSTLAANAAAGTYDFMAPELFSSTSNPTSASDVYALGVTLLTAVLGHSPYDGAQNVFMRRAMAMQGTPLDFAMGSLKDMKRCDTSMVQKWAKVALKKKPAERCTAQEWLELARTTLPHDNGS